MSLPPQEFHDRRNRKPTILSEQNPVNSLTGPVDLANVTEEELELLRKERRAAKKAKVDKTPVTLESLTHEDRLRIARYREEYADEDDPVPWDESEDEKTERNRIASRPVIVSGGTNLNRAEDATKTPPAE